MENKKILILSIITNIILLGFICSFININGDIIREKQIVKKMSESTQVTDLNNQINLLNTEHTEYMNYIQTCKTAIATALTNEGVPTSEDDTFEKMVTNIGDIFTQRTKLDESVAATADNITEGKQAYVNGQLITGTGADNNSYLEQGKSEGTLKRVSLGSVNSLNGASFNVSNYKDYDKFTESNFACSTAGFIASGQSVTGQYFGSISYNSSTGIVTFPKSYRVDSGGTGLVYHYTAYLYYIE